MSNTHENFVAMPITRGPKHHFFGYYGICPWNATGQYHLCLQSEFHDRPPAAGDTAVVGLVDMETGKFEGVAETQAWNLQQGSMLHWLPTAPDRLITYNARQDDRFVGVVQDIHNGNKRILPYPISAMTRHGRQALGLNYARLKSLRPVVGYAGHPDPFAHQNHPSEDGVYTMDTETGAARVLVSYEEAREFLSDYEDVQTHKIWFNHTIINRDDTRVAFVVRYRDETREIKHTILLSASMEGGDLRIVTDLGASHFDWLTNELIFGWVTMKEGQKYYLINDRTLEYEEVRPDILTKNGHCSFTRDGAWLLTDEYPDGNNLQALLLWHMLEERLVVLGRFHSPLPFRGEIRCDLHPRWSRDERQVSFDSIHDGSRQVYVVDVADVVN
ncbi:MAG: hypothetical protein F4Z82_10160 [Caldilineaceae bacterium SB0668_bin_21]|nr:hypothetical protein [Caldilineaceae bacterium SB0668_bin_21]MYC24136.1 hypothetical protein [Caldilineaceae bacterium SB0662_bin_25]